MNIAGHPVISHGNRGPDLMHTPAPNRFIVRFAAATACLGLVIAAPAARSAEYRFTPEPTYTPEAAAEIYKPLLEYLGQATGETFVLVTPANYSSYWRDILKDNLTDFSFDEAHFADYRIQHSGFIPLVKKAEATTYTLLANTDFEGMEPSALLGSSIATMPAPSLGYALLMQFFPDPVQQPRILSAASSWRDTVQIVFGGEAEAAIIPSWIAGADGYPNLVTIRTSRSFAGTAILASPTVPEDVRAKVHDALLNIDGAPELGELLLELGISKFVPASAKDYVGDQQMLSGFYGYK
jgi:ABC-type phosphate/phosphonate transport system substrate-binding protein